MNAVLLIDDDGKLAELLVEYCARFGLRVEPALTPSAGLAKLDGGAFDAVILDVMLPEMDGFEVIRRIRARSDIPIVMLSARGDVTDRIVGLELGADDYLPKPFEPRELVARVQANIKRRPVGADGRHGADAADAPDERRFEGFSLHPDIREVRVDDVPVELTTKEYELLTLLASTPGVAVSRDAILAALKGTEHELYSRSVDILVSRLRAKLKPATPVRTVHGAGYAFVARRLGAAE